MSANPTQLTTVMMRFTGTDRPGGDDFLVPIQRIPVAGDLVIGPDDFGWWRVQEVQFAYRNGLAFDPEVLVVLEREPSV